MVGLYPRVHGGLACVVERRLFLVMDRAALVMPCLLVVAAGVIVVEVVVVVQETWGGSQRDLCRSGLFGNI